MNLFIGLEKKGQLFVAPADPISVTNPASLTQKLDRVWANYTNKPLDQDRFGRQISHGYLYCGEILLDSNLNAFPRMQRFLDVLIDERTEQRRPIRVACVAAHRYYGKFSIEYLLRKGITVVSRESAVNHKQLMEASGYHNFAEAVATGQLICSSYDCEPHPSRLPYDLLIWINPGGIMGPALTDNLSRGAWLLAQHHVPFVMDDRWGLRSRELYTRTGLNPGDYLFPSNFLNWLDVSLRLFGWDT